MHRSIFEVFLPFTQAWVCFKVSGLVAADAYEHKLRDYGIKYLRKLHVS